MIAVAVKDYDDENVIEECADGWRRFCAETLVRTHYHLRQLCNKHRRLGCEGMRPSCRKESEELLRQVAAYQWVFQGTGGEFTFDQTCRDVALDPLIVRRKLLSLCKPERDINLLVDWVVKHREKENGKRRRQVEGAGRVGTRIVDSVRDFRRRYGERSGRRGAQTHPFSRYANGYKD